MVAVSPRNNMTRSNYIFFLFDNSHETFLPVDIMSLYELHNVSQEDINISYAGPSHLNYWEAWKRIVNEGQVEIDGDLYNLHWDPSYGLYAIPPGYDWDLDVNDLK